MSKCPIYYNLKKYLFKQVQHRTYFEIQPPPKAGVYIYNHIFYIRYIIYMVGKQDHINMRTRTLHNSRKKHAIIDLNDQRSSYPLWIAHRLARGSEMFLKFLPRITAKTL